MTDPDALPGTPGATEPTLSTLLTDIVCATSVDQALETMLDGLVSLTGATLLQFETRPGGDYRLARTRGRADIREPARSLHDAGSELAHHLPRLVDAGRAGLDSPGTMLFSRDGGDEHPEMPIRELEPFERVFHLDVAALAPLRFANEIIGAVVALWPAGTPITACISEASVIAQVSMVTAPTLHRMLRIERLRNLVAEGETIRRLTDSIARTPTLVGAFDVVCRSARLITGLDLVATAMTTSEHVVWHAASGATDPSFLGSRIAMPNYYLRDLMQRGQEVVLDDVRAHTELDPRFMPVHTRESLRSSVTIPVYVNARLRALILFGSRRVRSHLPTEIRTMHAIAGTVATAIAADDARLDSGDTQ